ASTLLRNAVLKTTGLALIGVSFFAPKARAQAIPTTDQGAQNTATDTVERTATGHYVPLTIEGMPGKPSGLGKVTNVLLFVPRRVGDGFGLLWGETEVGLERGLKIKLPPGTEYVECHGEGKGCRSSRLDLMSDREIENLLREGNI